MADWMDQILIQDLQFDPKHWQCEFPNLAILPECALNITVNDACSRWIFDKSIFSSTIVTDVKCLPFLWPSHITCYNLRLFSFF
jgi:hypothetical protein